LKKWLMYGMPLELTPYPLGSCTVMPPISNDVMALVADSSAAVLPESIILGNPRNRSYHCGLSVWPLDLDFTIDISGANPTPVTVAARAVPALAIAL